MWRRFKQFLNSKPQDPDMLKRLNEIEKMEKEDKKHILYTIDGLIRAAKLKNIAAL